MSRQRSEVETIIRKVLADMKTCFPCRRCSWTREEVYPLIYEIERLRAKLAVQE